MTTEATKISALVADDEPLARAGLCQMLAGIEWIACVGQAANGPAAVDAIDRLKPDLVLLDIQMPGLPGTDVRRRLTHRPFVVFTTAYSEHAVTAFELGALDYLLKPFGPERLAAALDRVRAAIGEPLAPALDRYGEFLSSGPMSRLFVRTGRAILPVCVDDIAWFEALGDYVSAHPAPRAGRGNHLLHLALSRLEERLDPAKFVRIHRTRIVNLDHVSAFRRELDGRLVAVMADGSELPVSKAKAQILRKLAH
jgi:two-component system LytT family response regulator